MGSSLTFVSDDTVDDRVRPGAEFRVHLKEALAFGGTAVAPAGTTAKLVVTAKEKDKTGAYLYSIALTRFTIAPGTDLPVKPVSTVVDAITGGMTIPAKTLGAVTAHDGKLRVAIPLPFPLSNDTPNGAYTPVPLKTAAPLSAPKPKASATPG